VGGLGRGAAPPHRHCTLAATASAAGPAGRPRRAASGRRRALANLIGTPGNDTIVGTAVSDTLDGAAGNDLIFGYGDAVGGVGLPPPPLDPAGGGAADHDSLVGGLGNDTVRAGGGNDTALGGDGLDQLFGDDGADSLDGGLAADKMAGGLGDDLYLVESAADLVTELAGEGIDSVQSSVSLTLAANVEELFLPGDADLKGTGNDLANLMEGSFGANVLDGKAGNDTIRGGAGDDTVLGGAGNDSLSGNHGVDRLDGGAGADTMIGGDLDDLYVVDDLGDVTKEAFDDALGGIDLVQSSVNHALGFGVDHLTLTAAAASSGIGNDLGNFILGNAAANTLEGLGGNDTLDGGKGADSMAGGKDNDVYVIENKLDSVSELPGEGIDTIRWLLTSNLLLADFVNFENATLLGTAAISLTGTIEANALGGNAGANTEGEIDAAGHQVGAAAGQLEHQHREPDAHGRRPLRLRQRSLQRHYRERREQ
jgi:Ca2+-binding RTX toxin-like protein